MSSACVGIVVPVYNAWSFTEKCLESIAGACAGVELEIVVVDNGSIDETPSACPVLGGRLFGDRFHYERFETNLNFGPACNAGAKLISAEYVFFLNNDITVEFNWLEPLLDAFDRQCAIGAVCPLLLYPETRRVQHLGVAFSPIQQVEHLFQYFPEDHPVVSQPRSLQAINAAALMMPRALFVDIGGFEPGYVNGFEDLELSMEIRRRGKGLVCVPGSRMLHYESQSGGRFDADDENSERFAERCGGEIISDMNDLLESAGYRLDVTPWFDAYAVLTEARVQELAATDLAGFTLQEVWEMLQAEPLWNQGYDLLARSLEAIARWSEAVEIRLLQQQLCPSMEALRALGKCASKAGRPQVATQCFEYLQQYQNLMTDPDSRARRFREINKYLSKQPESVVSVYRAALLARGHAEGVVDG